ncbi:MAG: helix-turn-helix transcriptional regulator [bacterium]|nr:helix-turn-helix transcriptional regulator [bacterium]
MTTIINNTVIFQRLTDIREDMDLNQTKMATKLGVSQATYSRWETGKEFIPLIKLNLFCNITKHSMDYVTGLIPEEREHLKSATLDLVLIGSRIKIFRMKNHLFQYELAEFLNTTQSTISAYENGKTFMLTAFAYQIAKEYKVSLDWLCGRIQNEYNK